MTYAKEACLKTEQYLRGMPLDKNKGRGVNGSMEGDRLELEKFVGSLLAINHQLNFNQPPASYLRYKYPPATPEIVKAIGLNMLAIPKFYHQVVHIMNRMNLVPPFHGVGPNRDTQDVAVQVNTLGKAGDLKRWKEHCGKEQENLVASDESEMESGDEPGFGRVLQRLASKRKNSQGTNDSSRKIRSILNAEKHKTLVLKSQESTPAPSEVFENSREISEKASKPPSIVFNVPKTIENSAPTSNAPSASSSSSSSSSSSACASVSTSSQVGAFLSDRQLTENRMSGDQLATMPVFNQYTPGVPTNQLYVKNLAKDVTQDDLKFIFGRYSKRRGDVQIDCKFQGKLRGQAWIKFDTEAGMKVGERQVDRALREIHGYILKNKPLHVSYAKSVHSLNSGHSQ